MFKLMYPMSSPQKISEKRTNNSLSDLFFSETDFAVVSQVVSAHQRGRIYYQGTYWFAYSMNSEVIPVGTPVDVLQRKDNTWLIKPMTA